MQCGKLPQQFRRVLKKYQNKSKAHLTLVSVADIFAQSQISRSADVGI